MRKTVSSFARVVVFLLGTVGTLVLFSGCDDEENGPSPSFLLKRTRFP